MSWKLLCALLSLMICCSMTARLREFSSSRFVVGSSSARIPQSMQKVSARAKRMMMLASTRCPALKERVGNNTESNRVCVRVCVCVCVCVFVCTLLAASAEGVRPSDAGEARGGGSGAVPQPPGRPPALHPRLPRLILAAEHRLPRLPKLRRVLGQNRPVLPCADTGGEGEVSAQRVERAHLFGGRHGPVRAKEQGRGRHGSHGPRGVAGGGQGRRR
mmetsp:Transcript_6700/g.17277  ORF Transcript_6700/g.17277 Transcript_6700/m.17277 type:complete len:217 (-) Transcript_6700:762-1412(-)